MRKADFSFPRTQWIVALLIATFFGAACVLPNILQRFDDSFDGIVIMGTDQEFYYGGRVVSVEQGDWPVANQYYSEPKDQPYLQPAVPEATIYWIGRLFGLNALTSFTVSKFFFGVLLTIVMIGAWTSITKKPWLSIVAVCTLLFANAALNAPWDILKFLETGIFSSDFLRFARPINPQWSATWFFLALWILASWIKQRATWKASLIGICMAVMLYSYVYAWSYLAATLGLLFLWYFWKREWMRISDIGIIFAWFFLLGIPYLINMWELAHHPLYAETAARQGLIHKRFAVFGAYAVAFIVASLPTRKMLPATWPLVPALAIAGLIALNQQLITGTAIVFQHYHWYFIQPLAALLILTLIFFGISRFTTRNVQVLLGIILCIGTIGFGYMQQMHAYNASEAEWDAYQIYAPVFEELSSIGTKGQVVFISKENAHARDLITVYTPLSAYMAGNANGYLTPTTRARDAMFFELWLEDLSLAEATERFPTDLRAFVSSRLYSIYYREFAGGYENIPDDIIDQQIEAYEEYLQLSTEEKLALYPLDFIIRTAKDIDTANWQTLKSHGKEIYNQNGISIVQFAR